LCCGSFLFSHPFEFAFFLLRHELARVRAALGGVFLAHDLGFELSALFHCAIAVAITSRGLVAIDSSY
jgi:hypothetical protein